jgi:zinc protease
MNCTTGVLSPTLSLGGLTASSAGTALTTLANGLTIITREDHSAPVVSAQAWCRAGSIDEGRWLGAGLSHVLEHMLFKGTTTRGAGRIDQEIQAAGGYLNAYTSFDRTVYWINVPSTGTEVALDVLCDILQHATLPAEELAKEMDVIRREMDMCQDDPARRASRRLFETAYTRSPYRHTVIGYPDVFNRLAREDIVAYYREKYAPNNLVLIVVGDVQTDAVRARIRDAFAPAKAQPLPAVGLLAEPRQVAPREVLEEAPVELAHLHFAWHIPELRHPDIPALDVLAVLLGGGRSSRLFQEVRERQGLVSAVEAWTYSPGEPGLFGVSAVGEAVRFDAARAALLAEVERMRSARVEAAEVAKAVKQFVAGTLAARKTMQGQAQDLGASWMAAEDLEFSERYLAAVQRVSPAEVQRVAQTYLAAENRTCYALLPEGTRPRTALVAAPVKDHAIELVTLSNGLRVLVKQDHRLPFVEYRLVLLGGVLAETAADNGVTQLMSQMLLQGTTSRTAEQIATEIEAVGGHLDLYGGNHSFGIVAEVLRPDFALGLDLVADVLLASAFPAEALAREQQNQVAAIKAQRDQMLPSAFRCLRRRLFGEAGYGLDLLGEPEGVLRLGVSDLAAMHRRLTVPQNAVLAVFGDVEVEAACRAVAQRFGQWDGEAGGAGAGGATACCGRVPEAGRVIEERDKQQAVVVMGFPGARLDSPDRFALDLLQEACSDLGSRLFLRVREKLGLAYFVGAQNFLGLVPGYFAFYAGTAPDQAEAVERELRAEARALCAAGLTDEELRRAKAKTLGQKKIARQDLGAYALTAALDELYGLGYANSDKEDALIEAVGADDIRAVAARYLVEGASVVAVLRPGEGPRVGAQNA